MRLDEMARGFMHTYTEFATSSSQVPLALGRVGCVGGIPPDIRERRRVGRLDGPVVANSPRSQANRGESAMTGPSGFPERRRSRMPGEMPIQPTRPRHVGTCKEFVEELMSVSTKPRAISSQLTSEPFGRDVCRSPVCIGAVSCSRLYEGVRHLLANGALVWLT